MALSKLGSFSLYACYMYLGIGFFYKLGLNWMCGLMKKLMDWVKLQTTNSAVAIQDIKLIISTTK
jgi:hypothetical protein